MTVHTFYSTDTGIPVLTGQAGAMIAIYDAVLVNGFNSKTGVTITRSGSVATATKTAHGYRNDQIILMSGATETEYNGKFRISNVTANTWDYTVTGTPSTPATGSPASIVAPAGFAKTYSGTNKAVYRAATGNRLYYRVDDSGTTIARLIGYETMSDVDTGTGLFPTVVQLSGGLYLQKSSTADATARAYTIVSNGTTVYQRVARSTALNMMGFGDYLSRKTGDAYNSFVAGSFSSAASAGDVAENALCTMNAAAGNLYTARSYTQLGAAVAVLRIGDERVANALCGSAGYTFPNPVDGGLDIAAVRIFETTTLQRGSFPGLYNPMHTQPLTDLTKLDGSGAYAGKQFVALNVGVSANGQVIVEISDTW